MMNLSKEIHEMDYETPFKEGNKVLTVKDICKTALLQKQPKDGVDSYKLWQIATKIHNADDTLELKAEEIVQVKNAVKEGFIPLIVGQVFDAIDG